MLLCKLKKDVLFSSVMNKTQAGFQQRPLCSEKPIQQHMVSGTARLHKITEKIKYVEMHDA